VSDEQDWSEIEVFADQLQARGDPRGELLALEMASERATSSEEARQLNREAQRVRDAHHELVWPAALARSGVGMRAGFVVSMNGQELTDPSIPIEPLLSARHLSVSRRRLEDCVPRLEHACRLGLRLEGLGHWVYGDSPTDLDCLRDFVELDARAPTLAWISFGEGVSVARVLTKLAALRSCSFDGPLSEAELRSLAPLPLHRLRLRGQHSTHAIVELFGDTLEALELGDCIAPLTPLRGIPSLRSLTLTGANPTELVSELHELTQLRELHLPRLDPPDLDDLASLRLRELSCGVMPAQLAARLPQLRELEALTINGVEGGPLDLSPLAKLPRLRSLVVAGELRGRLTLPAGFEWLAVSDATGPVPIEGEVADLGVFRCDPRWLSPRLLERVRSLRFSWDEPTHDEVLAQLPRLAPNIERLEVYCSRHDWEWHDAAETLGALPRLRKLDWYCEDMQQLAERARMLPELCLLQDNWPRRHGDA
jgi:hypothetical protein